MVLWFQADNVEMLFNNSSNLISYHNKNEDSKMSISDNEIEILSSECKTVIDATDCPVLKRKPFNSCETLYMYL